MKAQRVQEYSQFSGLQTDYGTERPNRRRLRIFALDPLTRTASNPGSLRVTIDVPNEDVESGPSGGRLRVIDYDGSLNRYYAPVDLDEAPLLMQDGLDPTESDPRFHQQMVYAVAMRVLENFERALGRTLHFKDNKPLEIYPHAFRGENAFFEPTLNAVLFGYFTASLTDPGENLPGQTVFSCLSHDIIAHEVTHAILYRLRPYFSEPTNPDVLAFHEAIADIVAIFQHFTFPDVLRDEIQTHHGELKAHGVLLGLAKQFGHGTGKSDALRSAFDERKPDASDYRSITEPHSRGSLLVSAVFDAFFVGYQRRIRDVVRLATDGTGQLPEGDLNSDLVAIMASEAGAAAQSVLLMCIRALEYLPPVDPTFGDFLRAIVTSDRDLYREDRWGMRAAMIEAFRVRGIYPDGVRSLAEDSLLWQARGIGPDGPPLPDAAPWETQAMPPLPDRDLIASLFASIVLGDDPEEALQGSQAERPSPSAEERRAAAPILQGYAKANARRLGFDPELPIALTGFHPTSRVGSTGRIITDVIAQFVQNLPVSEEESERLGGLRLRRGATVIFKQTGKVGYVITKPLHLEEKIEAGRELRSLAMIQRHVRSLDDDDDEAMWRDPAYFKVRMLERANFAMLDRRRARR